MECFQFLSLLHAINQNSYAIKKYKMKISNNHKLSYLNDWIEQMKTDVSIQNYKCKVYNFMYQILNHSYDDKYKSVENDFLIDLGKNASLNIEKIAQNESFVNTMCNSMTNKQYNWKKCNKKNIKLQKCKKCQLIFYCSKQCQKYDWNAHKRVCSVKNM